MTMTLTIPSMPRQPEPKKDYKSMMKRFSGCIQRARRTFMFCIVMSLQCCMFASSSTECCQPSNRCCQVPHVSLHAIHAWMSVSAACMLSKPVKALRI